MYTSTLLTSLLISLALTLLLEVSFALVWGLRKKDLPVIVLMNLLTNPAVVLLHFPCTVYFGWTGFLPILILEAAAISAEALCCHGIVARPWLFSLCINGFSFAMGELLQILL